MSDSVQAVQAMRPDADAQQQAWVARVNQNPDDAAAWCNLGVLARRQQHFGAAQACLKRALALSPDNPRFLTNLGNVFKDCGEVEQALNCQRRALVQLPDDVLVRFNYVLALRDARECDEAIVELDRLLKQSPGNAIYRWERALLNLYRGHFAEAWIDYEARWETGDLPALAFACPRWRGEALGAKNLLLVAEQGYGDTILAARFIALIQKQHPDCRISLLCKPELHRVFAGLGVTLLKQGASSGFDVYCPLMSLPGVFHIDDSCVPPPVCLTVPEEARAKWHWLKADKPGKLKVGIVWSGSITFRDNVRRSAELTRFLALAANPAVQLYSFQKGPHQQDLHTQGAGPLVIDLAGALNDFSDTAAAVEQMDVIIMTDSALAHLAGSLNKPVINLLQYKPYWLYATDERMQAWYPTMQSIRQETAGDWDGVFARGMEICANICSGK